jgi:L-threonylcarbamoyladenylate synthase
MGNRNLAVEIGNDVVKAAWLLQTGNIVAIPTETVYGLAANALNPIAVSRIFETKRRPFFDPLIVHIHSINQAEKYAVEIPAAARKLAEAIWPGPLTLLLPKKPVIPDITTSGLDTVGLRIPAHPLTLELLRSLPFPLAAPSANPFGYISPTTAHHVADQLGDHVAYILDGGPSVVGVESTIVGFEDDKIIVTRLGGTTLEELEEITGREVELRLNSSSQPASPGQLTSHYSPKKPFFLGAVDDLLQEFRDSKTALITFRDRYSHPSIVAHWQLSPSGSLNEAAANLFDILRGADKSTADVIIAEPVPSQGLGMAINDRLRRAAA